MKLGSNESIKVGSLSGDAAVKHLQAFNGQPLGGGSKRTTYSTFLDAAEKAGVLGDFTESDLIYAQMNPAAGTELAALKSFYNGATTDAQRMAYHSRADEIRRQVGDKSAIGGIYIPVEERGNKGQYSNRYAYNYDYTKDPTYIAMLEAYKKNAEISKKNTLARAAAMTGGSPSTYAVQAATAASNAELNQLALQIPSLQSAAYSRWADQRDFDAQQRAQYQSALEAREEKEYQRRLYESMLQREIENENRDKENEDRERALKEAQMIAELTGDYTKFAEILGVSPDSINMYQASLAANSSSGAKKSSGGSGSSSSKQGSAGGYQGAIGSDSWYQYMYRQYGDDAYYKILNEYKDAGISSKSQAQELALAFKEWSDNWKKEKTGTMMTKSEWARHKNSGSDYWGSEAPTYEDYVDVYRSFYGV